MQRKLAHRVGFFTLWGLSLGAAFVAGNHTDRAPVEASEPKPSACYAGYTLYSSDAVSLRAHPGMPVRATASSAGGQDTTPILELEGIVFQRTERERDEDAISGYRSGSYEIGPLVTPYEVTGVAARGPEDVFVFGYVGWKGNAVIERFRFQPQLGGYFIEWPVATTPIGVPAMLPYSDNLRIPGLLYRRPEERTPLQPQRELLYQDVVIGTPKSVVPDPEGRFLMILAEEGRLVRFDLREGTWVTLYDRSDLPQLTEVSFLRVRQHAIEGRVWHAGSRVFEDDGWEILFNDPENDGILNETRVMTRTEYTAAGYSDWCWSDDFRSYTFDR